MELGKEGEIQIRRLNRRLKSGKYVDKENARVWGSGKTTYKVTGGEIGRLDE